MSVVKRMLPAALLAAGGMLFATAPAAQAETSAVPAVRVEISAVSAQAAACSAAGYPASCYGKLSATKHRLYVYWGTSYVGFGELTRNGNSYHLMVCQIGVPDVLRLGMQVSMKGSSTARYDALGGNCAHTDIGISGPANWRGVVTHKSKGTSYTAYYLAP